VKSENPLAPQPSIGTDRPNPQLQATAVDLSQHHQRSGPAPAGTDEGQGLSDPLSFQALDGFVSGKKFHDTFVNPDFPDLSAA
jgi:hypothetical protein